MRKDLSIIYVYYNTPLEILDSINSLKNAVGRLSYEIIIVDNNSPLKLRDIKLKDLAVLTNRNNKGFGKAVNQGVRKAKGEFIIVLNPDTILKKDSIKILINKLKDDSTIGLVGPQMLNQKNEILSTTSGYPTLKRILFAFSILNRIFPNNKYSKEYWLSNKKKNYEQEVDVIGGACMVLKKELFWRIGGFDERFFMYFEESDLSIRIKKEGLKVLYVPNAKIVHYVGKSSSNRDWIKLRFQESRFKFLKKYYGTISALFIEGFIRYITFTNIALLLILLISIFINLYKINTLMLFIGDMGRDYIAARDMVLTGKIPLVGIQSSVKWLHQGPLSIYIIGASLVLGKFSPVFPAIIYGLLGAISTLLVYKVGKIYINKNIGLLAALFFATSPLVAINTRMPYHTSAIPLFASLFFIILNKVIFGNKKYIFFLFLSLGLLLQVELSNAVLFFLLFIFWFPKRRLFILKDYINALLGLTLGIIPFLIYDISHKFVQTGGFALWIINRIRVFLHIEIAKSTVPQHETGALYRIYQQLTGIIFPESTAVVLLITAFIIISLLIYKKKLDGKIIGRNLLVLGLWFCIPMVGFIVHQAPGVAYFPLLFPVISIFVAFAFYVAYLYNKALIFPFFLFVFLNAYLLIRHDFYLITKDRRNALPPESYSYGYAYILQKDLAKKVVDDSKKAKFNIIGGGYIGTLETGIDNYKYLAWYLGGKIDSSSKLIYTVYEDKNSIKKNETIIYSSKYLYLTKNE